MALTLSRTPTHMRLQIRSWRRALHLRDKGDPRLAAKSGGEAGTAPMQSEAATAASRSQGSGHKEKAAESADVQSGAGQELDAEDDDDIVPLDELEGYVVGYGLRITRREIVVE